LPERILTLTQHLQKVKSGGQECPPYTGFAESGRLLLASSIRMTKINIPTPLRQYAGKLAVIEVKAGTVAEALSGLVSKHPDLRRHLYTEDGKLRSFVNVYLNDEDVRYLQKEATTVKENDTISIVPSIAGGW
jgi:sulfur-carrier protein